MARLADDRTKAGPAPPAPDPPFGLRRFLLGSVLVAVLAGGLAAGLLGMMLAQPQARPQAMPSADLEALAHDRAEELADWFAGIIQRGRRLAGADPVRRFAGDLADQRPGAPLPGALAEQAEYFERLLGDFTRQSGLVGAALVGLDGQILLRSPAAPPVPGEASLALAGRLARDPTPQLSAVRATASQGEGALVLDVVLAVAAAHAGGADPTSVTVAALLMTVPLAGQLSALLDPAQVAASDARLRLVERTAEGWTEIVLQPQPSLVASGLAGRWDARWAGRLEGHGALPDGLWREGGRAHHAVGAPVAGLPWIVLAEADRVATLAPARHHAVPGGMLVGLSVLGLALAFRAGRCWRRVPYAWPRSGHDGEAARCSERRESPLDAGTPALPGARAPTIPQRRHAVGDSAPTLAAQPSSPRSGVRAPHPAPTLAAEPSAGSLPERSAAPRSVHRLPKISGERPTEDIRECSRGLGGKRPPAKAAAVTKAEVCAAASHRACGAGQRTLEAAGRVHGRSVARRRPEGGAGPPDGGVAVTRDLRQPVVQPRPSPHLRRRTVEALVHAMARHDPFLVEHARRVRTHAAAVGQHLALDECTLATLELAATLSQVGKIFLPDQVPAEPGDSEIEREIIRRQVDHALEVIAPIGLELPVAEVIAQMHERLDGSGHPEGLRGDRIGLPARILGVVDTYCARTAPRFDRDRINAGHALYQLATDPRRYDVKVVAALAKVVAALDRQAQAGAPRHAGMAPSARVTDRNAPGAPTLPVPGIDQERPSPGIAA